MNVFGSCTCPSCTLETRFLLETGHDEGFYLLGDVLPTNDNIKGLVACDYCQTSFLLYGVLVENVLSAFLSEEEYQSYQNGERLIEKASKNAGLQKEKEQELKQFHESFAVSFDEQPYEKGTILSLGKHQWTVQHIYKKEGVEQDIAKRLLTPTLDEYWYEVTNEQGEKKWCIVTDTHYERLYQTKLPEKNTLSSELKRVTEASEWYEFQKEDEFSYENEEEFQEHNAVLTIEAPFLKENEVKIDITDSLEQTSLLFDKQLTDNLRIKAYQYISGVRFFVVNKEDELEYDLFGENAETLLDLVQEQFSISVDEY